MSDKSKKFTDHNREAYNAWSSFYDTYPNTTVFADDLEFPNFWRHLEHKNVLEVGCGTGRHTVRLVRHSNKVTAVDLSPQMLTVARSKAELCDVKFLEADFLEYRFATNTSFDAVLGSLVLEHIEDLVSFFKKVHSVLAPGGEAFFSEIHPERALAGTLAHFKKPDGSGEVHLASVAHTVGQFQNAIDSSSLQLKSRHDILGPEVMAKVNPKWMERVRLPLVQVWCLSKPQ